MQEPSFTYADPTFPPLKRAMIRLVERATGQPKIHRLYLQNRRDMLPGESFFAGALRRLQLTVAVDTERLAAIPRTGPLVVVANHPFGVVDGLVIARLVEQIRSDFLVLTNAVLRAAPEVQPYLLPVDFAETEEAMATNLATRQAARKHLAAGGCIVVFPAGGISTAPDRFGRQRAVDAAWQPFTSQLIQRSRATVVPIFFAGQNSRVFQIASHIHLALRLSLIFREVRRRIGTTVEVTVGEPMPFSALAHLTDRKLLADELRARTLALGAGREPEAPRRRRGLDLASVRRLRQAIRNRRGKADAGRSALDPAAENRPGTAPLPAADRG